MASAISLDDPLAPPLPIHRFTVEQYHLLGEMGVLTPEDNVELLEGWIVQKMNQRPIHGFIVRLLSELLSRELPAGWIVQSQLPISTERSEPEPDLAIIAGSHADFRYRHPAGADCHLVIEVADTSLDRDRAKANIYRDAGVREYWIINVAGKCLERYLFSGPSKSIQPAVLPEDAEVSASFGESIAVVPLKSLFS